VIDDEVRRLFEVALAGEPDAPADLVDSARLGADRVRRTRRWRAGIGSAVAALAVAAAVVVASGVVLKPVETPAPGTPTLSTKHSASPTPSPSLLSPELANAQRASDPTNWWTAQVSVLLQAYFYSGIGDGDAGRQTQWTMALELPSGGHFTVVEVSYDIGPAYMAAHGLTYRPPTVINTRPYQTCGSGPAPATCTVRHVPDGTLTVRSTVMPKGTAGQYAQLSNAATLVRPDGSVISLNSLNVDPVVRHKDYPQAGLTLAQVERIVQQIPAFPPKATEPLPSPSPTPGQADLPALPASDFDPAKDPANWTDAKVAELFPGSVVYQGSASDDSRPDKMLIDAQVWIGVPAGPQKLAVSALIHRAPPAWSTKQERLGPFQIFAFETCSSAPGVACSTRQVAGGQLVLRRTVFLPETGREFARVSNAVTLHRTDGVVVVLDSENFSLGPESGAAGDQISPESGYPVPTYSVPEPLFTLDQLADLVQQIPVASTFTTPIP
jgi:hypothetical protein